MRELVTQNVLLAAGLAEQPAEAAGESLIL
jgi:hypothetical protein